MPISDRLGLNFDVSRFGEAANLSQNAANTLNLIVEGSGGKLKDWQINLLNSGPVNSSDLYVNRTEPFVTRMLANTTSIYNKANSSLREIANNLIIELNHFKAHTDNISGVSTSVEASNVILTVSGVPTLTSAENIGQLNMITLARTDGVKDTTPILGSFTSLFIQDELSANANTISYYDDIYPSNLTTPEIVVIENYLSNTQNLLYERRMSDWNYYANSIQLSQEVQILQEFDSMGGTMTYLVENVVGSANLKSYLKS